MIKKISKSKKPSSKSIQPTLKNYYPVSFFVSFHDLQQYFDSQKKREDIHVLQICLPLPQTVTLLLTFATHPNRITIFS